MVVEAPAVRSLVAYWSGDPKGQWVLDSGGPGIRVVERPLLEGEQVVTVAIDPGARCVIGGTQAHWAIGEAKVEHLRRALVSEDMTIELGRRRALLADQPVGWVYNDDNERVLSVKLHDTCPHPLEKLKAKGCGHMWCALCDGWVHPGTRVVLKSVGAVVKNNRKLHDVESYAYLFRENMAGSGRLTRAMQQRLRGLGNVAPPKDVVNSHDHDIMDDRVYDRRKDECKKRDCLYDHWSPLCSSHSKAQAHNLQRS